MQKLRVEELHPFESRLYESSLTVGMYGDSVLRSYGRDGEESRRIHSIVSSLLHGSVSVRPSDKNDFELEARLLSCDDYAVGHNEPPNAAYNIEISPTRGSITVACIHEWLSETKVSPDSITFSWMREPKTLAYRGAHSITIFYKPHNSAPADRII